MDASLSSNVLSLKPYKMNEADNLVSIDFRSRLKEKFCHLISYLRQGVVFSRLF